MGKKAGSKILKRSMAPNFWGIAKKQKRFVTRPRSGPHNSKSSMTLTVLLRDILKRHEPTMNANLLLMKVIYKLMVKYEEILISQLD